MAAVAQRLRIAASVLAAHSLLIGGCSLVQPGQPHLDKGETADRLVREDKHAEAARAFAALAQGATPQRDYYQLRAAQQWADAGDIAAARMALAAVSADARAKLPTLRALVAAQVANLQNDGVTAIRELDQIPVPPTADEAQQFWLLRGRAAFLASRPLEGTQAFVERERWLQGADALRANREELYGLVRGVAERGNAPRIPPGIDGIVAGWLDLGPVAVELARNPMGAAVALANWRRHYPLHPANDSVLPAVQSQLSTATAYPDQIALLLPLSGRSEAVGIAVRDGFIAAYLEQPPSARPRLRIYDVNLDSPGSCYQKALDDGASFVVGPLTKEDVAAVAPLAAGRAPILALNFLNENSATLRNVYQFALLPEDEARAVARRVVADGKLKGVALVPAGEWGSRVIAAFLDELHRLGGTLLDSAYYDAQQADFSDAIHQVLQIKDVKDEPSTHRDDAAFIFVAGSSGAARLIRPQLKFHYAGDVPMYSTSDSFEPDPSANEDLEGMIFPDMPWMISTDPVTNQIRDDVRAAWPAREARRGRLYAFGFDAYRLVPALRANTIGNVSIPGMTGRLHLDEGNRIRRELDWAEIKGGVPTPL
jgi:uncharacterized protein